ncbi:MAG: hypothetical protein IJS17_07090 [Clostridia bacterium]|nr:hypothetical protein [Clostridia bacterium]
MDGKDCSEQFYCFYAYVLRSRRSLNVQRKKISLPQKMTIPPYWEPFAGTINTASVFQPVRRAGLGVVYPARRLCRDFYPEKYIYSVLFS